MSVRRLFLDFSSVHFVCVATSYDKYLRCSNLFTEALKESDSYQYESIRPISINKSQSSLIIDGILDSLIPVIVTINQNASIELC